MAASRLPILPLFSKKKKKNRAGGGASDLSGDGNDCVHLCLRPLLRVRGRLLLLELDLGLDEQGRAAAHEARGGGHAHAPPPGLVHAAASGERIAHET